MNVEVASTAPFLEDVVLKDRAAPATDTVPEVVKPVAACSPIESRHTTENPAVSVMMKRRRANGEGTHTLRGRSEERVGGRCDLCYEIGACWPAGGGM